MTTEGHRAGGTEYRAEGVRAYAANRHGPDGAKFLDPFFTPYLANIQGHAIDIGAGAGPWAIFAAQRGAHVLAVDSQSGMTRQARTAVIDHELSGRVFVAQADAARLPSVDASFSTALSINVGCNLPASSFQQHFNEMARVLTPGGHAVVTAPTSFGEVFTNGVGPKAELLDSVHAALDEIGDSRDQTTITRYVNTFPEIHRATFAWRNNSLTLITDENDLQSGEMIWRKLPGLTVPNYYHQESEYVKAAKASGLQLVTDHHAMFTTDAERVTHNLAHFSQPEQQLGPEYVEGIGSPPFAVFVFEKVS